MSPFVAAIALPFGLTLALTLVLYTAGSRVPALRRAGWPAVCAVLGFLVGYVALEGWPPLIPVASKQKFFAIAIGSSAVAGFVSFLPKPGSQFFRLGALVFWALVAACWVGIRRLGDPMGVAVALLLVAAAGVAMASCRLLDRRGAPSAAAPVIATGAGFAAVALHGASASLSLLAAAIAASAGAIALVAAVGELVGGARVRLGEGASAVYMITLMAIAGALVWFTPKADPRAIALLALAPVAGVIATRLLPTVGGRWRALLDPLGVLLFAGIPVGVAVLVASRSALME